MPEVNKMDYLSKIHFWSFSEAAGLLPWAFTVYFFIIGNPLYQ